MTADINFGLGGNYPATWEDFIGQDTAKRQLQVTCRSAKMRGEQLSHTLLSSGTPGIGKTSLAILIAKELGTNVKIVSGKVTVAMARLLLSGMNDGDVLFWDEIHMAVQGGKANAEWLLNFLQDGVIMGPLGAEQMPKITVIGATTDAGKLPETILTRFSKVALEDYTDAQATRIASNMCASVFHSGSGLPFPSLANCIAVAQAACNSPRLMRQILEDLRDIAMTEPSTYNPTTQSYDLAEALDWRGLDADGLNDLCRRYIVALATDFVEGAGEKALADRLQEPGGLSHVERVLMAKGMIAKTKRGRVLTAAGLKRVRAIRESAVAA